MSIMEKINEINDNPENEKYNFGKINDIDDALCQSCLDPNMTRLHPDLFKLESDEIIEGIDQIYTAANAGDPRAKILILAAAKHEVDYAGNHAQAFPDKIQISDDELYSLIFDLDNKDYDHKPLTYPIYSLRLLDESFAQIEIAIEDANKKSLDT